MFRGKEGSAAKTADFATISKRHFLKTAAAITAGAAFSGTGALAADKDTIRIGYISPRTGPFAPFAEADEFIIGQIRQATAGGISVGGKTYKVELIARDDQSNPDRASNLAVELINKQGIDLMLAQGALGVVPVSQQCELNGIPCITTMTPWQAWLFPLKGDPAKGFKNVFHFFWGVEDIASVYLDIWNDLPTNKVVGSVFSNDVPGNAMGDLKLGMPGLFNPPEWATFLNQSAQMGLKPKVATIAKALLFPGGVAALGPRAEGMSTEIWWLPAYPFRSSLTGQTAAELASAYEATTKRDWTQPLGVVHALFEAGFAALKASSDPKSAAGVVEALRGLKQDTVIGRLDFAGSGVKNVSKMRVVGGQWHLGAGGKPELFITNNKAAPEIPVQRKFELLNLA